MPLPTAGTGRNKLRAKKSCEDLGLGGRCPHQPHHPAYCATNNIGAPVCFLVNAPEKWPKQQGENRPSKDQISLFRCGKGTQRHGFRWYFTRGTFRIWSFQVEEGNRRIWVQIKIRVLSAWFFGRFWEARILKSMVCLLMSGLSSQTSQT